MSVAYPRWANLLANSDRFPAANATKPFNQAFPGFVVRYPDEEVPVGSVETARSSFDERLTRGPYLISVAVHQMKLGLVNIYWDDLAAKHAAKRPVRVPCRL
ncbi:MAG: hypothetical protein HN750_08660 [Gemmatimonadales bacterium]|jgi:hypothetical protein|nr:hypothetical protein [Gemmatimonadales bacterium]